MRYGCIVFVSLVLACAGRSQSITSPGGVLDLEVRLSLEGEPSYALSLHGGKAVITWSRLGLELKDTPSLLGGFSVAKVESSHVDETWKPVWGEESAIRNRYAELCLTLQQGAAAGKTMLVRFRLFDDGLGFRYEFPVQPNLKYFIVSGERTEFALTGDHTAFWIPGDYDTNEYPYVTSTLSRVDASKGTIYREIGTKTLIARNAVQTPLMMKTAEGLYLNIHEAALVNYPAMDLLIDQATFRLTSTLVPDALGNKAYLQTPCLTPWRTVIVSTTGAGILRSRIILNLNEPCKLKETAWIKPQKFVGIWWGMHIGTASWNYANVNNVKLIGTDWKSLTPNGKHGATTAETKRYIDFAAKYGFGGVLVEGWNVGWEDWWGNWKEEVFDFVTPYPDFDVDALEAYAREKGVKIIMHHETSASVTNYERRMDEAFRFMKKHGYDAVKTGYVGRIIPRGEYHDGQWMVNHYVRVAEKAAAYGIMVDAHEPVRPTGLQRTYPNWLACEAARGNEYNAWSRGNPPEHETILPFTRLMGGPMDYTPGIFQIKLNYYDSTKKEVVHTTLAKQLALYVTLYSPLQMAADLPENYERFPDAFQFIRDVAVDWDATEILEAEPGDVLVIARKAKGKDEWYIGGITDENARTSKIALNFLPENHQYEAVMYADAPGADWEKNPMAYSITKTRVKRGSRMTITMAPGGGAAISIRPVKGGEKN